MARPPPARPHMAVHSSTYLSSFSSDWGEDDAWDSASDSESAAQRPTASASKSRSVSSSRVPPSSTAPRPVPPRPSNSSSSTLASSYTHLHAPSPSSYPPHSSAMDDGSPRGADWHIVSKTQDLRGAGEGWTGGAGESPEQLVAGEPDEEPRPSTSRRLDQGSVRHDVEAVVNDPMVLVTAYAYATSAAHADDVEAAEAGAMPGQRNRYRSIRSMRERKFIELLSAPETDIGALRTLAWNGIPNELRPVAWPLLLGYAPIPIPTRAPTLARKRAEYVNLAELTFARGRDGLDQQIWHQIEIDVPRTRPGVRLWMQAATQRSLERILYVWAIRHPASGYVQGINDLATPFFQVFLSAYIESDPEDFDPAVLPPGALNAVEADTFWCLSRLLDGIQDNYIAGQPGIQRSVKRLGELVARIDRPLAKHLADNGVEFMQFAFRWMNCLLMRELSVQNTIRMWDTYLAEGADAFSQFHLYVCTAFLTRWSAKLQEMDFQGIIMFLQSLPTQAWSEQEVAAVLGEAFVHSSQWHNAQSHFA